MRDIREARPASLPLSEEQAAGVACVWCGEPLLPLSRRPAGFTGLPTRQVFACPGCSGRYRLPTFPEPFSV